MKMLLVTTDWMKYYVGEGDEEKEVPLCGYNFQNANGSYYGFGNGLLNIPIECIEGTEASAHHAEDVLVVWLAPNKQGENCIVGWYKEATVYKAACTELTLDSERLERTYSIVAPAKKALLLPVEERRFVVEGLEVPVATTVSKEKLAEIRSYIHNYAGDQMNLVLTEKELNGVLSINMEYERYFYKADEFLAKDMYAKAIRCFNKAIQEDPEYTLGYECKASVLLSLKMYDEALALYHKVIELDAETEQAYYCLGLIYGLKQDYEKACLYFDQYLGYRSEDIHAYAERGYAKFIKGDLKGAAKDIEFAYTQDKTNPIFEQMYKRIAQK